jgi:mRNA interferase RelE/StbE
LRGAKKLHPNVAAATHDVISKIIADPISGEKKKADLEDFYIVKFQPLDVEYLIAYSIDESNRKIRLEAIGAHENFYRDLKRK